MKNRKIFFPLAMPLCQKMNLLAFLFITAFLIVCSSDDPKTIRERLIANDWENRVVTSVWGYLVSDVYTGVYNFSADGTYTQTFNDSILSGKWEMQGDSIVVFNKEDIAKKRFWRNIEISEDYLRVLHANMILSDERILPNPDFDGGQSYSRQVEEYIRVK